ncbi:STN domain-containing protein [Roseivirga pacifica]|uniref:STN domain-containing protein n=1 Tax=Roseivirga pacifica TaxID=1267423 RepID=UPI003BA8EE6A
MARYILTFLLLIGSVQAFAQADGLLNRRFTLNEQNTAVEDILKKLESDDLRFTYSPQVFDVKRRVTVNFRQEKLSVILQTLFRAQDMEMVVMGSQVLIRKKKAPAKEEPDTTANSLKPAVTIAPTIASEPKTNPQDSLRTAEVAQPDTVQVQQTPEPEGTGGVGADVERTELNTAAFVPSTTVYGRAPLALKTDSTSYNLQLAEQLDFPLRRYKTFVQQPVAEAKPQKSREIRTLADRRGFRFAASLNVAATPIVDQTGILIGGRFNFKSSPSFGVGFAGAGFLSPKILDQRFDTNYRISGGYGGFLFEYTAFPRSKVHVNLPLLIGGGGVTYIENDITSPDLTTEDTRPIFVAEGGVELEVNIFPFFRIGLGAIYRHTSNGALRYTQENGGGVIFATEDLSGLSGMINLKLGRF